jgi:hypothetical protein
MAKNKPSNKKDIVATSFYIALSRFRTKDHSKIFEIGDDVSELKQDELDSLVGRKLVSVDVVESKVIEDPSEKEQDEDEPKNENE